MRRVGVTRRENDRAVDAAYAEQRGFQEKLLDAGSRALAMLEHTGEPGLVLAGRGYNLYDRGVNCDIPRKLRHRYGANVIPLDFVVTGREPDLQGNMFWISGRKILEAARVVAEPAQSPHGVHHEFQVRPRFVHQAFRPRGRRRADADSPIRRTRQRCRVYDALRGLSGQ